mmetsp:Transcript_14038/g.32706  ORF Transcript_14038/g.32706 Transcript_14038/m.32706 type:complete len:773 (+) Transcript_14038:129-2447(+)
MADEEGTPMKKSTSNNSLLQSMMGNGNGYSEVTINRAGSGSLDPDYLESAHKTMLYTTDEMEVRFEKSSSPKHRAKIPVDQRKQEEQDAVNWKLQMKNLLPILDWASNYGKDTKYYKGTRHTDGDQKGEYVGWKDCLRRDVLAGIVIGIMLVPQGMAYGMLAGLPPVYGLYTSMWTLVAYMVTGTCRFLGPGVNAPISLLVADAVQGALGLTTGCGDIPADVTMTDDCQDFIDASLLLCLMVGVMYIILAVFRLGIVTALMPKPALSGFTTGASMIIISSNMKFFLGLDIPRGSFVETWISIFWNIGEIRGATVMIGIISLCMLRGIQILNRHPKVKPHLFIPIPEQLVVLLLSIIIVGFARMDKHFFVDVVGEIPSGLKAPELPPISMERISVLMSPAITVALVTYILTINVAKAVAAKANLNVDANQELVSLAAQSLVGAVTHSCVPSGSFSRTALIQLMDAESLLHNMFSCIVVGFVCLVLTEQLYYLPKSVLAAIIFLALRNMIDTVPCFGVKGVKDPEDDTKWKVKPVPSLWKVSKSEWFQWVVAFLFTTFMGVTGGIFASIGLSLALLLKTASHPNTAVLGQLEGTQTFVPMKLYGQAKEIPGVKVFRYDGPITFASKDWFETKVIKMFMQDISDTKVHSLVLDVGSVGSIDTSAATAIKLVVEELRRSVAPGLKVYFGNWRGNMDDVGISVMEFSKLEQIVPQPYYLTIHAAVEHAIANFEEAEATKDGGDEESGLEVGGAPSIDQDGVEGTEMVPVAPPAPADL